MPSLLQKLIADQRRYTKERIKSLRAATAHLKTADRFVKRFAKRNARVAYFAGDEVVIEADVDNFKLDAMKVIEWIEKRGYNAVKSEDVAEWRERRFYFVPDWNQSPDATPVIRFDAALKADGPKCKRVQVGVKVEPARETPVYEFRCA
jgi:hypothetical protein